MAFAIKTKVTGLEQVLKALDRVDARTRKKILRKAVNEAGGIVLKAAKEKVARGATKLLHRSLGRKIKIYRNSGIVVAIVGPRSGFKTTKKGKQITALGKKYKTAGVNPTKYAHLVEGGRKAVRPKKSRFLRFVVGGHTVFAKQTAAVPPRPFMRPAIEQNRSTIRARMKEIIEQGIQQAARS